MPVEGRTAGRLRPGAVYPVLAFVVVVLGVNWPVMAVGLRSVSPVWMATLRLLVATATLFVVTAATGRLTRPPRSDYPIVVSVAAFRFVAMFLLVFFALRIVPPGRSSILVWTAGLWTVPIAAVFLGERMNRVRWMGLVVGIAGILLVFEPTRLDWSSGRVIAGHLMLLGAATSQAGVSVHIRRHTWASTPMRLMPWQLAVATAPMVAVALALEGVPEIDWSPGLAANLAFQGAAASGIAIWGQLTVLRNNPAISTNLAMMAVPVIGLLASAVALDEQITVSVAAGLALVLAGVALSRAADLRRRRSPRP